MKPFAIKDKVIWIGALHPDLRVFDIIMQTKNGTTYNSYLIQAEKPTIIDTVKSKYSQTYLDQLSELVDLQNLTYIVVNTTNQITPAACRPCSTERHKPPCCAPRSLPNMCAKYRQYRGENSDRRKRPGNRSGRPDFAVHLRTFSALARHHDDLLVAG
jgi:hypothetical protein